MSERRTIGQWIARFGVSQQTYSWRRRHDWSQHAAMSTPAGG